MTSSLETSRAAADNLSPSGPRALAAQLAGLSSLLQHMHETASRLLELGQAKQRALVVQGLDQLEELVQQEEQCSSLLAQQEQQRLELAAELANGLGRDPAGLSLSELAVHCSAAAAQDPAASGALLALAESGAALATQLEAAALCNQINAQLQANALEYTRILLGAISQGAAQPQYASDGQVHPTLAQEMLDLRA